MGKLILVFSLLAVLSARTAHGDPQPFKEGDKYGYKNGDAVIVQPKYGVAHDFKEGLALVATPQAKYGFIDKTGREVIPLKYLDACDFSEGLALVLLPNYARVFMNKNEKIVIKVEYDFSWSFHDGLAMMNNGAELVKHYVNGKFDRYNLAGGKWGFIGKTGKAVVPLRYECAKEFSEGLAAIQLGGAWGFVDTKGSVIIQPKYDTVESFLNGTAKITMGDKHGYIDKTGAETWD